MKGRLLAFERRLVRVQRDGCNQGCGAKISLV
jgi:hypothetical protein